MWRFSTGNNSYELRQTRHEGLGTSLGKGWFYYHPLSVAALPLPLKNSSVTSYYQTSIKQRIQLSFVSSSEVIFSGAPLRL